MFSIWIRAEKYVQIVQNKDQLSKVDESSKKKNVCMKIHIFFPMYNSVVVRWQQDKNDKEAPKDIEGKSGSVKRRKVKDEM